MGQTLTTGVYLPDEGERNCYTGLAGNWQALDNHLGNANIHVTYEDKQAWNNHIADTVKHVTAEDKAAWNGKADASALTAHTGDTTIHVTAEDKQAWNNHIADTVKHVTAEDKAKWDTVTDKANDADVVHKSGNETISGAKRFSSAITSTAYPSIRMYRVDDEWDVQPTISKQAEIRFTDKNSVTVSYFAFQHRASSTEPFRTCWRQQKMDGTSSYYSINFNNLGNFYPEINNAIALGTSAYRWSDVQTYKVNALEPSSLSLPSGNANDVIDISSYLSNLDGTNNTYVAPANGWITINMNNCSGIHAAITGLWSDSRVRASAGAVKFLMPVLKNQTVTLTIHGGTINNARFIPCQGNV